MKGDSGVKGKCGHHKPGDKCYECGYGINRFSLLKVIATIIVGLLLGWCLSGTNFQMVEIIYYIELVLLACVLGVVIDIRKMLIACGYKRH